MRPRLAFTYLHPCTCLAPVCLVDPCPRVGAPLSLALLQAFDAQAPSPALTHLLTTGAVELAGRRMLVPGCGRGYDLIAFLRSGVAEAVGLELSTSAQQQAEAYLQQQLTAEEKAHAKVHCVRV